MKNPRRASASAYHTWKPWHVLMIVLLGVSLAFLFKTTVSAVPNIVATMTDTIIGDDGDGIADPGETIEYNVSIANTGANDASGLTFNDMIDAHTTLVGGSLAASAVATNDTFPVTVVGNVSINSGALATPFSVIDNDFLGLNPTATIEAVDTLSANFGNVSMIMSGPNMGQFTYNPPAGFEGVDTFTYTLSDNPNAPSNVSSRRATVSITVSGMIWFIDNNLSPCIALGCGRLSYPFSSLEAFNDLNGQAGPYTPKSGDAIFIYESATHYAGTVTLLPGQRLIGQDASASLATITGLTPPVGSAALPAMESSNGTQTILANTVTLNSNTLVRGLSINSTISTAMNDPVTAITGVNVSEVQIRTTTGTGVDFSNTAGTLSFTSLATTGGTGVNLVNNPGGTFTFSSITVDSGANPAFNATGGGTVNVCDDTPCQPSTAGPLVNTLNTTTGTALNVVNTNIGTNSLEFRSISSDGAVNGIVLNNTGTTAGLYGGLKVRGEDETTGTGGTIQNTSNRGASFINTRDVLLVGMNFTNAGTLDLDADNSGLETGDNLDTNAAIHLVDVTNATLDVVRIDGGAEQGINGHNVVNFNITGYLYVNHVGGEPGENALHFYNMSGTSSIGNTYLDGTPLTPALNTDDMANIQLQSGSLNLTFSGGKASASKAGNGYVFGIRGTANATITLRTVNAHDNFGAGIVADAFDSATMHLSIINSSSLSQNDGQSQLSVSANDNSQVTLNASNNLRFGSTLGRDFTAVNLIGSASGTGYTFNAQITNNASIEVGNDRAADGIKIVNAGGGTMNVALNNNTISYPGAQRAILVQSGQNNNGQTNLTLTGNNITIPLDGSNDALGGILTENATDPGNTSAMCVDIGGSGGLANTFTHSSAVADGDIRVRQRNDGSVRIPGYVGGPNDTNAAASYLDGRNTTVSPATVTIDSAIGGGGACAQPSLAMAPDSSSLLAQVPEQTAAQSAVYADSPLAAAPRFQPAVYHIPEADSLQSADTLANSRNGAPRNRTISAAPLTAGETINLPIGNLPASKRVVIRFQVTVDALVPGVLQIDNQGTITANDGINVLTDDPDIAGGSDPTVTLADRPATTITSITTQSSNPSSSSFVTWQITFADPVAGLSASNFSLVQGGSVTGASITGVTETSGPPATTWNITADTGAGNGTLEVRLANASNLSHIITNVPYTEPDSNAVYNIDKTAPTITSVSATTIACLTTDAEYCNAGDVATIHVAFSDPVYVSGTPQITLETGAIDRTASYSGGSGTNTLNFVYTVQSGDTSIDLDYVGANALALNGGSIIDEAGNDAILTLPSPSTAGSLGANDDIVVDTTAPTVSYFHRRNPLTSPTNADTLEFEVDFSEPIGGPGLIGTNDFVVVGTPGTTAAVNSIGSVDYSSGTYSVNVNGGDLVTYNGTVGLSFSSDMEITDRAGNPIAIVDPSDNETYTLDNVAPTVAMNSTASDPTNISPIPVTVTFSENVSGFAPGDITVSNGTISYFTGGGNSYSFDITPTGDGVVTANIGAGVAQDSAGNGNSAASQFSRTYDSTAPSVSINSTASDPTNVSPIPVTVTFSKPVSGFAPGDITVSNGTISNFTGSGDSYTFDLIPTADGTVTADIAAGVAQDSAGNGNSAASQFSRTYDTGAPSVSISSTASDPTNVSPIPVTVTFSENVTGFSASDIVPSNGTISNFAGSGDTYTFDLIPTADGTVTADIAAGVAQDSAGNGNSTASQFSRIYDSTAPSVSISSTASDPTNVSPIPVTVTFSENVTGFSTSDIVPSNGTISNFAGSGDSYTFDLIPTADGTVTADIAAGVAQDSAGNGNSAASQFSRTYDTGAPSISINSTASDPTNVSPIPVTVTFSEYVSGFAPGDITVSNGTVSNFAGSGDSYTFDLIPTADGTVTADIAAGVAQDSAGNGNSTASQFSRTYDSAAPSVSISSTASDPTNVSPIPVTVTFSKHVSGFAPGDITVSNGTISNFAGSGDSYTFDLIPTANGTVTADIGAGVAQDSAGNGNSAASQFSRIYDSTAPDTFIDTLPPTQSSSSSATFSFHGIDTGSGLARTECRIDGGSFSTCISSQLYSSLADGSHTFEVRATDNAGNIDPTPDSYTWTVDTTAPETSFSAGLPPNPTNSTSVHFSFSGDDGSGVGGVTFECKLDSGSFSPCASPTSVFGLADGSHTFEVRAIDMIGNTDPTPASHIWTVDTASPSVVLSSLVASPTNSGAIIVTITFNEPVNIGSGVGDLNLSNSPADPPITGGPTVYTFTLNPITNGPVTAQYFAGSAFDAAGNANTNSNTLSIIYDSTAPTVALTSTAANPTSSSPIPVTVTFSENVTGFAPGDITVSNGTVSNFTGSGDTYTFDFIPTADGTVTADIGAGVAQDSAGNSNSAASQFSRTYDTGAPTVTISSTAGNPTNSSPIPVSVTFSENVTGFTDGDMVLSNATISNFAGSGDTYTFDLIPTADGTVTADIGAGVAQDVASNGNSAAAQFSRIYDSTAPNVTINQAASQADPATNVPVNFTMVFNEAVNGLDAHVAVSGSANPTSATVSEIAPFDGTTYNVAVSGMTANGTVVATVPAGTVQDAAGNTNAAATSSDNIVTFSASVAVATGIVRANANPTNATSVQFTVSFSANVTGVDASDFITDTSSITGATITSVTGSGVSYTVTVNTGSGNGTLGLHLLDNDTIVDDFGLPLAGVGSGNGNFTGQTYQIDKTPPSVGELGGAIDSTFTIVFSDNLALDTSSLDNNDIRVTGPNGFNQLATFVNVSPVGNGTPRTATYHIDAPSGTWDSTDNGSYTVTLVANQVQDTAGNSVVAGSLGQLSVNISPAIKHIYLPLVTSSQPGKPDLVVTLNVEPSKSSFSAGEPVVVQVTVTNQGTASAKPFWVDLYINPASPPNAANQLWNTRCNMAPCFGIAWAVEYALAPGESITLSSQQASTDYSQWPGWFAAGTSDLYAYADSYNPGAADGAVAESNESNNRAELHGLSVNGQNPTTTGLPSIVNLSRR